MNTGLMFLVLSLNLVMDSAHYPPLPHPEHAVFPTFTPSMGQVEASGVLDVEVEIDVLGRVKEPVVVQSRWSGSGRMIGKQIEEAVIESLKQWRYPARKRTGRSRIRFKIALIPLDQVAPPPAGEITFRSPSSVEIRVYGKLVVGADPFPPEVRSQ